MNQDRHCPRAYHFQPTGAANLGAAFDVVKYEALYAS